MIKLSEQQIIDQLTRRLAAVYRQVEPARVTRVVQEEYARFEGRPIRDYIPLFVERHAKDQLSKLGV
jgi:(2Fe-2S) ferredoxin